MTDAVMVTEGTGRTRTAERGDGSDERQGERLSLIHIYHYIKYGFSEGRNSFGTFDARAYADRYPDLKAAFGYDVLALYKHYLRFGRAEGRDASAAVAATSSYTESSYSGSSNTGSADNGNNTSTNTAPLTTAGRLVNPETGAPVAGATVVFKLTSFNVTAEEVEAQTEVAT